MSLVRRLLDGAKSRHPDAYWRVRGTWALGQWYAARLRPADESPYDDAFWDRSEVGDWEGFARAILRRVPARSVLDVGCGGGRLLEAMRAADPSLRLAGTDSSGPALERARRRGLDARELDIVSLRRDRVDDAARSLGAFDLAISLEVAEHVPAWHSGKLLRLLARHDRVVFSAAHPNQGGTLHVNEQPAEHWIARFGKMGFALAPWDADFRREIAALDLPWWYAANIHAFERAR